MKYCIDTVSPGVKVESNFEKSLEMIMRSEMCWFQKGKFYVYPEGDFEHGQFFDIEELRRKDMNL